MIISTTTEAILEQPGHIGLEIADDAWLELFEQVAAEAGHELIHVGEHSQVIEDGEDDGTIFDELVDIAVDRVNALRRTIDLITPSVSDDDLDEALAADNLEEAMTAVLKGLPKSVDIEPGSEVLSRIDDVLDITLRDVNMLPGMPPFFGDVDEANRTVTVTAWLGKIDPDTDGMIERSAEYEAVISYRVVGE